MNTPPTTETSTITKEGAPSASYRDNNKRDRIWRDEAGSQYAHARIVSYMDAKPTLWVDFSAS